MWLCVIVVSLLLPFMEWNGFYGLTTPVVPISIVSAVDIPLNLYVDVLPVETNRTIFVVVKSLFIIYLLFAALLSVRLILSYVAILTTIRSQKRDSIRNDDTSAYKALLDKCKRSVGLKREIHLIVHDKKISPFSWMNNLVISRDDLNEAGREILIHELSHVKYRHSWDILIIDLLIVLQWFNPIVWLYKQSLLQTHEYMADKAVLDTGVNSKLYQLLLIKKTADKSCSYAMTNSLNQSKLKNRIVMMLKEKSSKWAMAKCLYLLPLACVSATLFAMPKVSDQLDEISTIELSNDVNTVAAIPESLAPQDTTCRTDTSKVVVVGFGEMKETGAAIRGVDKKNKPLLVIDGKESTKDISTISPDNIKSMSVLKGESAVEIYGEKAKGGAILVTTRISKDTGKPANTSGKTPFSYKQEKDKSSYSFSTNNQDQSGVKLAYRKDKKKIGLFGKDSKILVIIDGKESTKEMNDASPLDPKDIESMTMLKDKTAVKMYGEKAKHGVVLITTKKNKRVNANEVIIIAKGSSDMEDVSLLKEDAREKKNYYVSYRTDEKTEAFAIHTKDGILNSLTIAEISDDKTTKTTVNVLDKDSKYLIVIDDKVSTASDLSKLSVNKYQITILKGDDAINKYGDKAKEGVVEVKIIEKKN